MDTPRTDQGPSLRVLRGVEVCKDRIRAALATVVLLEPYAPPLPRRPSSASQRRLGLTYPATWVMEAWIAAPWHDVVIGPQTAEQVVGLWDQRAYNAELRATRLRERVAGQ